MKTLSRALTISGTLFIFLSISLFVLIFYPIILEELKYSLRIVSRTTLSKNQNITPIDTSFGIVIPKIGANARVIAEVDPYDAKEYQVALTKGVAHAKGSRYPGNYGNIFLFSHSSVNFYEATRYNSIFYLLDKLEAGDEIFLYYKENKYTYTVKEKKIVSPKEVSYLSDTSLSPTLTLMTCWPAGTSLMRLIVISTLAAN